MGYSMKTRLCLPMCGVFLWVVTICPPTYAQRQMEKLGRGVIAMRSGTTTVYIGWRLLASDPEDVGFNLYRVTGAVTNKPNGSQPITNTTDYVDSTANLSVTNSYFVRPVTNSVELAASAPFVVPGNALVPVDFQGNIGPYLPIPLQSVSGGGYYVHHVWPADLDGDGEYDYVLSRLPDGTGTGTTCLLEAYKRDGTFLWRADMGYNSTNQNGIAPGASAISVGDGDGVTAYDMDGDGKAEVLVKTAKGVVLPSGTVTASDDITQYISVLDGMTGNEKARATIPNPYTAAGPMKGHFGIMYCDGVQPSLVFEADNRNADQSFNLKITTWDYRNGQLTQRWTWDRGSGNYSDFHAIRIADVDHDGKDEFCEGSFVIDDNGQPLFGTELIHGDRFQMSDLDPDRPGLETYAIQQDNLPLVATALYDSSNGRMIKKWCTTGVVDVGRGNAGNVDGNTRGVELWSTQPGLWSCKGDLVSTNLPTSCNFSIWWDADLVREQLDSAKIDKYGTGRLFSPYNLTNSVSAITTWRNAQPLYGDLFGDWREEALFESSDHSQLMIFMPVSPSTARLICLAQDPEYRECMTVKGYMQTTWPDYYLGVGMPAQPIPPVSGAKLVWRGGGSNLWDVTTANWLTNGLWISNNTAVVYSSGDTVLFDTTGSNSVPINLVGTFTPGAVTVYSPNDYTFNGGSLTGAMKLTKAGAGRLTLNNTNTFTGRTLVTEGSFIVNGSLSSSPVTVRGGVWLDGRLGGNGSVGAGVTAETGGGVSPGNGTNAPGTLTIAGGLTLLGRTLNDFDLSDDPSGTTKTNDRVNVTGNVTLQGTNTLVVWKLNGSLPPGTYTLITYTGALIGGLTNLTVAGLDGVPIELTNPAGAIALVVKSTRAPTTLTWVGGLAGNAWDLVTTSNWWNGATLDQFSPQDTVRFDSTGSTSPAVNLIGSLNTAGVVVDSTSSYTFSGSGAIMGSSGLTKTNSGTLTINANANTYTGRTIISGGTLAISDLDVGGSPSSIGAADSSPTNLMMYGSTLKLIGYGAFTDRGITLGSGTNTIDASMISGATALAGQLVGAGALCKDGTGQLNIISSNSYAGGTIVKAGVLQLATVDGNQYGPGTGTVTFAGGTLAMENTTGSDYDGQYFTGPWSMIVPANATGQLSVSGRGTLTGSLTGSGTLTVFVPFVRIHFNGDWSAFAGRINVTTDSDGGDFRVANSSGFPNARLNLANKVLMYSRATANSVIPIGEFSADFGATVSAGSGSGLGAQNAVTWRVGGLNTDAANAATILGITKIVKEGSGTWTLTSTNSTYSGDTTVSNGTLLVNNTRGSGTGTGVVTVASGGTLGGTGVITGPVTVNGTLAPGGNAVGTLTISNNLVVNSGATLSYALGATSDRMAVSSNLTLAGTLNVTDAGGFTTNTYILFTYGKTLTTNGVTIGTAPAGYTYAINTDTPGQVNLVVTLPLTPFQQWQMQYFGCTNCPEAAATADPDGDGQNNLAEFLSGTNPTDGSSALRIISVAQESSDMVITWTTVGGFTNAVQAAAGDSGGGYTTNFTDVSGSIIISGSGDAATNYVDAGGATNNPSRYYRVRVVQ
jgi:fibronectin-binding autotransporter adhesin